MKKCDLGATWELLGIGLVILGLVALPLCAGVVQGERPLTPPESLYTRPPEPTGTTGEEEP